MKNSKRSYLFWPKIEDRRKVFRDRLLGFVKLGQVP
jgi:hypothetical protein